MFKRARKGLLPFVRQNAEQGNAESVGKALAIYRLKNSMGTLDDDKSSLLEIEVKKFNPLVALELGGSYGYAAIKIALNMTKRDSKLIATEMGSTRYEIAKEIIEFAGLSQKVTLLKATVGKGILNDALGDQIKKYLSDMGAPHFGFIFIDHYPSCYLPDFRFLEDKGMLGKGTGIVANTMGPRGPYDKLQDYMKYLKDHPEKLETETYKSGSTSILVSTYIVGKFGDPVITWDYLDITGDLQIT